MKDVVAFKTKKKETPKPEKMLFIAYMVFPIYMPAYL